MIGAGGLSGGLSSAIAGATSGTACAKDSSPPPSTTLCIVPLARKTNRREGKRSQNQNKSDGSIEGLIRDVDSYPAGFFMTGNDIANKDNRLSLASSFLKTVKKVDGGIKVKFTWGGRVAVKMSRHSITDGTVFKIRHILLKNQLPALHITASDATFFGKPFNVYIKGNSFSEDGIKFYKIF